MAIERISEMIYDFSKSDVLPRAAFALCSAKDNVANLGSSRSGVSELANRIETKIPHMKVDLGAYFKDRARAREGY